MDFNWPHGADIVRAIANGEDRKTVDKATDELLRELIAMGYIAKRDMR